MNRYLPKEKIQELKDYIESVLPLKVRKAYRHLRDVTGIEFYYDNEFRNKEAFNRWITDEVRYNHPVLYNQLDAMNRQARTQDVQKGFNKFKKELFGDDHKVLDIDILKINEYINGQFLKRNEAGPLHIVDIINSDNIDTLLSQYEKKNVDPKLLQRTEQIKKRIDDWYSGVPYNVFQAALTEYMKTGQEYILHNIINNKWE